MLRRSLILALVLMCPRDGAASWPTNPYLNAPVCVITGVEDGPVMCPDGQGGVIVAWTDRRGSSADIYAQRINAAGYVRWTANGVPVCMAPFDQTLPSICSDAAGGAILTWQDARNSQGSDVYAQRIDSTGAAQWTASGVPVCVAAFDQLEPHVAADGAHGAFIAWRDLRDGMGAAPYVQHLGPAGGVILAADGTPLASPGPVGSVQIVSDLAGGAIVGWSRNVQKLNATGSPVWNAGGTITGAWDFEVMAPDSTGGVLVAASGSTVRVQRIASYGYPAWAAAGVVASAADRLKSNVSIACDSAESVVLMWRDTRDGPAGRIYGQRVGTGGLLRWSADGTALCPGGGPQSHSAIASDHQGGSYVCFEDARTGAWDLYAQHLNRGGGALWPAAGVATSLAFNDQLQPLLLSHGTDGFVAAWLDRRNDGGDVYAQWVASNGLPGGSTADVPRRLVGGIVRVQPNPVSGSPARLEFAVPHAGLVQVSVYDIGGRRVRRLASASMTAGSRALSWDARDDAGAHVPAGAYLVAIDGDDWHAHGRVLVLR